MPRPHRAVAALALALAACAPPADDGPVGARLGGAVGASSGGDEGTCSGLLGAAHCGEGADPRGSPPPSCELGPCPSVCVGGACVCRGQTYGSSAVSSPPNVMIVLDRSGSMTEDGKWDAARAAVNRLVASYGGAFRFGLELFPSPRVAFCGRAPVLIDVGPGTAPSISATLAVTGASGGTPMAEALQTLVDWPSLQDPVRESFVLLVTDGVPSCADPVAAVRALRGLPRDVRTFVVGFGSGVDPATLDALAREGGTDMGGAHAYLQADDEASLDAAFAAIAEGIVDRTKPCTYALAGKPENPTRLFVRFDDVDVPPAAGWSYDEATNALTFEDALCDALLEGLVDELALVEACPGDGVEPPPCVPATCAEAAASCGPTPDGCGGTLDCGTCAAPLACGGAGRPNACG